MRIRRETNWSPAYEPGLCAFSRCQLEGIPPERFFAEYARTLVDQIGTHPDANRHLYAEAIEEHFQRIAVLSIKLPQRFKGRAEFL